MGTIWHPLSGSKSFVWTWQIWLKKTYKLDHTIPRRRGKCIFLNIWPIDREHLPCVFLPDTDGKILEEILSIQLWVDFRDKRWPLASHPTFGLIHLQMQSLADFHVFQTRRHRTNRPVIHSYNLRGLKSIYWKNQAYYLSSVIFCDPPGCAEVCTEARCNRPLPTKPKFAEDASAKRVVWKGDHARE